MRISVIEGQTIGSIQEEFSRVFPFLKIEFFKNLELNGVRVTKKIENNYSLSPIEPVAIDIDNQRTVEEVKKDFLKNVGLLVRVYRKSGNVWIETSLTDDWSLERQNFEGEQMNDGSVQKIF